MNTVDGLTVKVEFAIEVKDKKRYLEIEEIKFGTTYIDENERKKTLKYASSVMRCSTKVISFPCFCNIVSANTNVEPHICYSTNYSDWSLFFINLSKMIKQLILDYLL